MQRHAFSAALLTLILGAGTAAAQPRPGDLVIGIYPFAGTVLHAPATLGPATTLVRWGGYLPDQLQTDDANGGILVGRGAEILRVTANGSARVQTRLPAWPPGIKVYVTGVAINPGRPSGLDVGNAECLLSR